MAEKPKLITEQQRLEAFAMFTLAAQMYADVRQYERGISRALGHDDEYVDHISDAIYSDKNGVYAFDTALARASYKVKPKKRR